ncbi:metal ABC transporter solute-binding protein, Zn/Mn family [Macrococcus armenti]|uniref:metal ABC transporter solute-binding protein, Zn/Mn family n=1 Tax=Macrococcus armenti TaxID=2875764 RepID=UPI001CCE58A3|nr:zinc ABC transporter substrate-binding protein [Macrococcus armenti]UBH14191.1 zinc ABC transporter substrate-binding protein [Macrococcus armenti]UBH23360.1 zinc ABC transporter substrate-binding protein [Macrococcus armenti]
MKKYFSLLLVAMLVLLAACGSKEEKSDGKLKVYTTVFPYKSIIEQIGGDHVDVTSIYPQGIDIHSFEPTQKDTMRIAKSDLFIYSGEALDAVGGKIDKVVKDKTKVVALDKAIKESDMIAGEAHDHDHEGHGHDHEAHEDEHDHEGHDHGAHDPHIWLDPVLNKAFAKQIKDELIAKDKANEKVYEENYKKLIKDLDEIDMEMKKVTKNKKHDTVFISHDSLGYLAHRYGFKQEGVSGMNNEEPSQSDIINMINNIDKTKASVILYEQNIPTKTADIIKDKTKIETAKFHNLAVLTKDDKKDVTYQDLMKENIKSIDKALNN